MDTHLLPEFPNLLIGVGASAGGLKAILEIIDLLPETFQAAMVVAVHRNPESPNQLAPLLQKHTRLHVQEPVEGESLACTNLYVAPSKDLLTIRNGRFRVGLDPQRLRRFERIDDVFYSIAKNAGPNAVGVVLSGMLWDGVRGLQAIKEAGGACLVQDPRDAAFDSMPRHALAHVDCDYVGNTMEIASRLMELAIQRHCQ